MNRVRWCLRLAAMALAMSLGAHAAQAAIVKPAVRSHTAAVVHAAPAAHANPLHRHARHHRHHHVQPPTLSATNGPSHSDAPIPVHPRHNRTAIPSIVNGPRHAPGARTNLKHGAMAQACGEVPAIAVRSRALRQNLSPDAREHPVTSGRGPPRASPNRTLADFAFPESPIPAPHALPSATAPFDAFTTVDPNDPVPATSLERSAPATRDPSLRYPGLPHGRLHAVRPEGATACITMPSSGGFPCPAPSPSSRSCSRSVC